MKRHVIGLYDSWTHFKMHQGHLSAKNCRAFTAASLDGISSEMYEEERDGGVTQGEPLRFSARRL